MHDHEEADADERDHVEPEGAGERDHAEQDDRAERGKSRDRSWTGPSRRLVSRRNKVNPCGSVPNRAVRMRMLAELT